VNPGRKKLVLRFELPRGSYATLIVKRITAPA
jgi:tRNA pseudouridine13 synthase